MIVTQNESIIILRHVNKILIIIMINCYFYLSCPLLSVHCSIVFDCYPSDLYVHVYVTEFIFCQLHLCTVSLHLSHVTGHLTSLSLSLSLM